MFKDVGKKIKGLAKFCAYVCFIGGTKLISIILVVIAISTLFCSCGNGKYKAKFDLAVDEALSGNFDEAKALFSEIPLDYQPKKSYLSVDDWINDIDKYGDSEFIGEWTAEDSRGSWELEIEQDVYDFSGIVFHYSKRFATPGGTSVSEFGELIINEDGTSARYSPYSSKGSNYKHYSLELANSNTIEIYFNGELEVKLHRS